nr:unnamed protein product [Digitaria exilis]
MPSRNQQDEEVARTCSTNYIKKHAAGVKGSGVNGVLLSAAAMAMDVAERMGGRGLMEISKHVPSTFWCHSRRTGRRLGLSPQLFSTKVWRSFLAPHRLWHAKPGVGRSSSSMANIDPLSLSYICFMATP